MRMLKRGVKFTPTQPDINKIINKKTKNRGYIKKPLFYL